MKIEKKDLGKSQIELTVELSIEEFKPYIIRGAEKVSQEVKIEGFRPGKAPYDILKAKIGEMTILEEAAHLAVNKTIEKVITEQSEREAIGQSQVNITKLAPDNPLEYKVTVAMLPQISLGDFKKAKVKQEKSEVGDHEVGKLIDELREMRVKEAVSEKEAQGGDKVMVNIRMFLDKVPLEGGQAQDTPIIIGKNYVVPGFDKKIIGAKRGEKREFELVYPTDHHQKNIAGKLVEFTVEVKEVYNRELPEANEDFAAGFGVKNMEELKANIKKSLIDEKTRKAAQAAELKILEKIVGETKFTEIPEILVNNEAKTMIAEMEYSVEAQGGKFDDYLAGLKKTQEQFTLDLLPEAIKRVKASLAIREISKLENIKVEPAEINQEIDSLIKQYKNDSDITAKVKSDGYRRYLENVMTNRKVIEKLREWNVEN